MLKIGYFQFRPAFGKPAYNLKQVISALNGISADIIVLPELAFTGYFFKDRQETASLAEDPKESAVVSALIQLCRDNDFYIVTGFAEKARDKIFNSALLIGPGGLLHTYRKIHLFNEEKFWFDPGDKPLSVQEVRGAKFGMMVCFDWIFPETTRTLAKLGADIICHPSNLVLSYCQQAMLTRCLENNVFAITANRFGEDKRPHGSIKFTGKSQIVAPRGQLLHRAPSQKKTLHIEEIDVQLARDKMITNNNHLFEDRRPDFYKPLCET